MGDEGARRAFARRLRALMASRGLSVKALLWAMDETPDKSQKVYSWLSGERVPSYEGLLRLHRALRCSWGELMGE